MTDVQAMVAEFHEKFGHPNNLGQTPNALHERTELRKDLIEEEFFEFLDSHESEVVDGRRLGYYHELTGVNTVEYADALADLVYVAYGAALEAGIDLNAVLHEVHRANMTKVWPDGKVHYHPNGKVAKPAGWQPPNIEEVLGLD